MKKFLSICTVSLMLGGSLFGAEHVIDQKGKEFIPNTVKAKVGDTIKFKNSDPFAHNAFSDDPKNEFDIGMQGPNEDKVVPLKAKGKFDVGCNIHPNMKLTVTVE